MAEKDYFDSYESKLVEELLRLCTSAGMLDGVLLQSEDIDRKWDEFAPEYMADALHEIAAYPEVAIAWAGYLGMAVAEYWDLDWAGHSRDNYESFHGSRGFDNMDDHIMEDVLGHRLGSAAAKKITHMMETCAQCCISYIRHEQIEPQTVAAYHVFVRTVKSMYRIGEAMQLKMKGYKFEKVNLK